MLILGLLTGWLAAHANASQKPTNPLIIPLNWTVNDLFGGFYTISLSVGTPPQPQRLLFDTSFSDIEIHAKSDPLYAQVCPTATPIPVCSVFDNTTSSTFHDYGGGTYFYMFQTPAEQGDYVSDTLSFGYGVGIKNQTLALANSSAFPFANFGLAGPSNQVGFTHGIFPEYPSFLQNFVNQGYFESSTFSIWLSPSLGPSNNPNSFPDGKVIFGGLDTGLFQGKLTTLPVVNSTTPTVVEEVGSWSLALTAVSFGNGKNIMQETVSCVIGTGSSFTFLPPDTFNAIVNAFPEAVHNSTTGLYEVSCSERDKVSNSLTLTLSDPRISGPEAAEHSISFDMPAGQIVWPQDRLTNGGDLNKCALAVFPVETNCELGISALKNGYWVYDLDNAQISYGQPRDTETQCGELLRIPMGGVPDMRL